MSGTLILGLLAGLLIFLGGTFCWRRGWLGGGDVKLLTATAVLVPPSLVVNLLLDVALAGGVLAMIYLAMARLVAPPPSTPRPPGMLRRIYRAELYRVRRRGPLPYASAIAAGTLFVLFKG
jgi:prepilin peptidase CpaA